MPNSRRHAFLAGAALALAAVLPAAPAPAEEAASVGEALKKGRATLDLRLRYETVTDDERPRDAHAPTLRTALGFRSAAWKGFQLFVEAENVAVVGNDLYDNRGAAGSNNGVRDRPVVADPAGTEIQQALLRWENDDWKVALGRQEIVLGDARFVGNVGWRQNHQGFAALRVDTTALDRVTFTFAHLDRVNRIFGDSLDLASQALWAGWKVADGLELTGYALLLDYREPVAAGLSTSTFGLELAGRRKLGDHALLFELELAEQSDFADNPASIDAGYSFLMLGAALPAVTVKAGWEVLEGSAADGQFRTPLATLHKFNGWADKFLATPSDGLEDLYLAASGTAGGVGWLVRYHDFSAESGGASYGRELDLQLLYSAGAVTFGLKGALYDADRFSVDTDKWFLWAAYRL